MRTGHWSLLVRANRGSRRAGSQPVCPAPRVTCQPRPSGRRLEEEAAGTVPGFRKEPGKFPALLPQPGQSLQHVGASELLTIRGDRNPHRRFCPWPTRLVKGQRRVLPADTRSHFGFLISLRAGAAGSADASCGAGRTFAANRLRAKKTPAV